jgi:predicted nucleic acid-binding protein
LSAELAAQLRRNNPDRWRTPLTRRADPDLPFDPDSVARGARIMLDATAYIDALKGQLPAPIQQLLVRTRVRHSAVARAELATSLAMLDPAVRRSAVTRRPIEATIKRMLPAYVAAPSASAWTEAALLSGILARLNALTGDQRKRLLNDALILMTAREHGATLVSRNITDMDLLTQMRPDAKILLYRA